jgi:hypothetical protein
MKDIAQVEKKSLTNAERQRAYRQRKKSTGVRLDTYISEYTGICLDTLLMFYSLQGNMTKKELLERLIKQEYDKQLHNFPDDLFSE